MNRAAKDGSTFNLGTITKYSQRASFFRVECREQGTSGAWTDVSPGTPFVVFGQTPQGTYNMLRIQHIERGEYEYRFLPICGNIFSRLGRHGEPKDMYYNVMMEERPWTNANEDAKRTDRFFVSFRGERRKLTEEMINTSEWVMGIGDEFNYDYNQNPAVVINDFYTYEAEDSSHRNGPEHEIVWVNEFVDNADSWYKNPKQHYDQLAYAGIVLASSREYSNFSELSAYFKRGIEINRLTKARGGKDDEQLTFQDIDRRGSRNLLPEIAYDLLSDKRRGAGEMVGRQDVHEGKMREAARFCEANGFYWDGVIPSAINLREWIFEQASYCMLDFTIIGGMFALVPAVPYNKDYTINFSANITDGTLQPVGLWTDGNMRNYQVTFLDPEERQSFVAEVKYRIEEQNGFPNEQSLRVRLSEIDPIGGNVGTFNDPVEVFDLTQFCTTREHALNFAKYALRTRQHVDHAIRFETTPDCAAAAAPGDYIRVASEITHHYNNGGRFAVGSIDADGYVQAVAPGSGTFDEEIYYWRPGYGSVRVGTMRMRDGKVENPSMYNCVISKKPREGVEPRLYKVESISYTDEGMVDIAATFAPTNPFGQLKVLQWDDDAFVIEE